METTSQTPRGSGTGRWRRRSQGRNAQGRGAGAAALPAGITHRRRCSPRPRSRPAPCPLKGGRKDPLARWRWGDQGCTVEAGEKAATARAHPKDRRRRSEERRRASPEKTHPEGRAECGRAVVWLSWPNRGRRKARPTHAPASARPGRQPKRRGRAGLQRRGRGAAEKRLRLTAPGWVAAGSDSRFPAAAAGLAGRVTQCVFKVRAPV